MSKLEHIRRRIAKLDALAARNSNENEAKAARAQADKLRTQYATQLNSNNTTVVPVSTQKKPKSKYVFDSLSGTYKLRYF